MVDLQEIERRVSRVKHGFRQMRTEALEIVARASVSESQRIANQLHESKRYQARMVGVFVLGYIASRSKVALQALRKIVSTDESWQVQEILAQAFNEYCKGVGYERALPTIVDWLEDKSPNVRRAVTEGLRIWNQKEYFREHPQVAIQLLSRLNGDESEYVRRSVGKALRDISRKEKDLVRKELATGMCRTPRWLSHTALQASSSNHELPCPQIR